MEGMKMTKAEARKAAKGASTSAVDLSRFTKDGEVGKLLRSAGVLDVGLSMYVFSKSRLEETIEAVREKIKEPGLEDETYASLVELQRKLVAEYNVTAKGIIESIQTNEPRKTEGPRIVLPPNTTVTAVLPPELPRE
jgi:hypothetical protein